MTKEPEHVMRDLGNKIAIDIRDKMMGTCMLVEDGDQRMELAMSGLVSGFAITAALAAMRFDWTDDQWNENYGELIEKLILGLGRATLASARMPEGQKALALARAFLKGR